MLELRELVKHYPSPDGEPIRAVDGVSTTIAAGELVALYGPSGSGKSTLLMLIAALMKPDSGAVFVDGQDVSQLSSRDAARYRRLEMGFVRQQLDLLPGVTALDNAILKLLDAKVGWREARRRVTPLLEELGLGERLDHRAEQLSMGERQRVLIARALSSDPKLVLADEPTGSLDSARGAAVMQLLTDLCHRRGTAMLLVTHDPTAVTYASRTQRLLDGRLIDEEPQPAPPIAPS
jgi:putative ABC transport system ATP-binding protein